MRTVKKKWPMTRLTALESWKTKTKRRLDPTNHEHIDFVSRYLKGYLRQTFEHSLVAALFAQAVFGGELRGDSNWVYIIYRRGEIRIVLDLLRKSYYTINDEETPPHDPHLWYYNKELWDQLQETREMARKILLIFRGNVMRSTA
jgi:hypothetical protein